uniref:Integrase, catalytic region, zinc finger, CCHC-type, peptidase aspartic, catalytic n=1 Tax=Tanacetum cinerariifolium TaxID=118510 RepID=A0A699GIM0_TANCI|nr:hypothetical protein [Tanacetum cinerariifolium]
MMLNSIDNIPLVYGTIVENGVTRLKKYEELKNAEKIQDDCDLKATNIILQGLPPEVYSLVNHHQVTKDIWDRVNLLMQGTELSYQECECKLYDEFDRFTSVKGDDLIACLNKAMAFMSIVMASRFPSTNNQLITSSNLRNQATIQDGRATIQQVLDEEQLAFLADLGITDGQATQTIITHNATFQTDDLDAYDSDRDDISSEKAVLMANLSSYDSDILSENRNAKFAAFQHEIDLLKQTLSKHVKEKESFKLFLRCYLVLKIVIMDPEMQCTTLPGHSRFSFSRFILDCKIPLNIFSDLAVYPRVVKSRGISSQILRPDKGIVATTVKRKATWQDNAFDFDCDEAPLASTVLMAKLSAYDSDILSDVPTHNTNLDNQVIDQSVQEMQYSQQPPFINDLDIDITNDSNVISYEQYLKETKNEVVQDTPSSSLQDTMIIFVIEEISNQVTKFNQVNKENKTVNESLTTELERYKEQINFLEERYKEQINFVEDFKEIYAKGLQLLVEDLMLPVQVKDKRIEQYFLMTGCSLWDVILNGNSPTPTRVVDGVVQPVAPTIAEQRLAKKNELKA